MAACSKMPGGFGRCHGDIFHLAGFRHREFNLDPAFDPGLLRSSRIHGLRRLDERELAGVHHGRQQLLFGKSRFESAECGCRVRRRIADGGCFVQPTAGGVVLLQGQRAPALATKRAPRSCVSGRQRRVFGVDAAQSGQVMLGAVVGGFDEPVLLQTLLRRLQQAVRGIGVGLAARSEPEGRLAGARSESARGGEVARSMAPQRLRYARLHDWSGVRNAQSLLQEKRAGARIDELAQRSPWASSAVITRSVSRRASCAVAVLSQAVQRETRCARYPRPPRLRCRWRPPPRRAAPPAKHFPPAPRAARGPLQGPRGHPRPPGLRAIASW